jgi:hypothetical protein
MKYIFSGWRSNKYTKTPSSKATTAKVIWMITAWRVLFTYFKFNVQLYNCYQKQRGSRNLRRCLHRDSASFKMLLEATGKDHSHQYIKNSNLSIDEKTFMLCFSESVNVTRAFNSCTGHYRAGRLTGPNLTIC